jgi:hypothetical protein
MHEEQYARGGGDVSAGRDPAGLAGLGTTLRAVAELQPAEIDGLQRLTTTPVQPVRLSYAHEDGAVALFARRAVAGPHDERVLCTRVPVPDWLMDASASAPDSLDEAARRDLAELVRASFAVLEARLAEHFDFATGNDTLLAVEATPPRLMIRPATTPSPRLQPALPTHGGGYVPDGDRTQAGGARPNRGTGGTGVDGTRVPNEAAVPGERTDEAPLGGDARPIEGTLGQAIAEGSVTDDDPPAASPGRLGH